MANITLRRKALIASSNASKFTTVHSRFRARLEPLVRLWMLRILVPLGPHMESIDRFSCSRRSLEEGLGIPVKPADEDEDEEDFERRNTFWKRIRLPLRKLYRDAERIAHRTVLPKTLLKNIEHLGKLVGLDNNSKLILGFSILLDTEPLLKATTELLQNVSTTRLMHLLSQILDIPEKEIIEALRVESKLHNSGLLQVKRYDIDSFESKLVLLSKHFADYMTTGFEGQLSVFKSAFFQSIPPTLVPIDYRHLSKTYDLLHAYVRTSLDTGRKGVNILLHGLPGTGKTELARLIAHQMQCDLFEIASEDEEGSAIDGASRLRGYRAAQAIVANKSALLLFDETEDVFGGSMEDSMLRSRSRSIGQTSKAWVNSALENNGCPTFWLTNSVSSIDPAFIRRFDLVIELPIPPRSQRKAIIEVVCNGLLSDVEVNHLASDGRIAPAIISRAAAVVASVKDYLHDEAPGGILLGIVDQTLRAQGHDALKMVKGDVALEIYDPSFITTETDLVAIVKGIKHSGSGRLCLYGPPGTGKTAFGKWLANEIDKPLLVKRASDLISKWVGKTEQNLAQAFREAEQEDAVLLIDEVDSFLQDRRGAARSWEVTKVNEMLTQMEAFSGIFVATTNLVRGLDQAALRRFDLKVMFDYLRPDQSLALLDRYCDALGLSNPSTGCRTQLQCLCTLTPGDFASVARRNRFSPLNTVEQWVLALEEECDLKEDKPMRIGFV